MKPHLFLLLAVPGLAFAEKTWGPAPEHHIEKIDAYYMASLKDRDSVKTYAVSDLFQCKDSSRWNKRIWCACVKINAKNSFGAYTGTKVQAVLFDENSGEIRLEYEAWRLSMDKQCAAANYQDRDPLVLATPPRA